MSRLDSAIRRLEAQRACLDAAADLIREVPGVVFELGLGNGRTFDHLRERLPNREIFVFERTVNAHPSCIPDDEHLFVGNMEDTLPALTARFTGQVALVHADVGTGDPARNAAFAGWLGPILQPYVADGGVVLSDQQLVDMSSWPSAVPDGVPPGRYYFYCRPSSSSSSS